MNLYEIAQSEDDDAYRQLANSNHQRHYHFLGSMIRSAIDSGKPWLSESLIKAINFHAIVGLHSQAGQYRSNKVVIRSEAGEVRYTPPEAHRVHGLMEDFVNRVNWEWKNAQPTSLAAYALWRINAIHPFVNGNGRTARAVCYYILCVKYGGLLPSQPSLPEIIRAKRAEYVKALRVADQEGDLVPLTEFVIQCLREQLSAEPPISPP